MDHAPIPADVELVANQVIGAAIEVHRHLGSGFIEKIYHEHFASNWTRNGFHLNANALLSLFTEVFRSPASGST
jgi:GxxExxY protein